MIARGTGAVCPRCGHERERGTAAYCPRCGFDFRTLWSKQDRRHRGPLGSLVYGLWRIYYVISCWFVIGWCWRKGILGRIVAVPLAAIWTLLVLALIGAAIGPPRHEVSRTAGALTGTKVAPTTQPQNHKKAAPGRNRHKPRTAHRHPTPVPRHNSPGLKVITSYMDRQTGMFLTVREALIDPKGDSFTRPHSGKEFELFYVTVRNGGSQSNPTDLFDFSTVDQSGQTYGADIILPMRYTELPSTGIPAGEKRAGWIGFEIPKSSKTVTLTWEDNFHLSPAAEVARFGIRRT